MVNKIITKFIMLSKKTPSSEPDMPEALQLTFAATARKEVLLAGRRPIREIRVRTGGNSLLRLVT
jgi:hypothetical protein